MNVEEKERVRKKRCMRKMERQNYFISTSPEFLGVFFIFAHCVAIFGQVLDQGYPQSGLNINLHLTAVLFYESIIKNSITLFFMGLIQTKYGGMFPA